MKEISLSAQTEQNLNKRLLLAYTGVPRLAKNILQKVLRQWSLRSPHIIQTVKELVSGAHQSIQSIEREDYTELGRLLSSYWSKKKIMAGEDSGVEPKEVCELIKKLSEAHVIDGASLAGAGGGGFLALLLKDGNDVETVKGTISQNSDLKNTFTWWDCNICSEGLTSFVTNASEYDISWQKPEMATSIEGTDSAHDVKRRKLQ